MKKQCFICKDSKISFLLKKDGYNLWHCEKCKLNFIHPQPTEKELERVYSLSGGYSHSDKGFDKNGVSPGINKKIDFFVKNNKKKVLDVGCASGSFVYFAKEAGLNPIGIDLDPDSIKFGQKEGLDLRNGTLKSMKFKKESFDGIHLGDIIEHIKDPESFLKECLRILKKDGTIIISTPNTNSFFPKATKWLYKKLKIMWSHPTPPYHLFDFSDKNLIKLLKNNNLEIKNISYSKIPLMYSIYHTGYFDNLRSNMNGNSKKEAFKGILKSLNFRVFQQLIVTFIYGIMFVVDTLIEKRGDQMIIYVVKR